MNGTNAETSQREKLLSFPWHVLKSSLLLGREQQSHVHGVDFPAACLHISRHSAGASSEHRTQRISDRLLSLWAPHSASFFKKKAFAQPCLYLLAHHLL